MSKALKMDDAFVEDLAEEWIEEIREHPWRYPPEDGDNKRGVEIEFGMNRLGEIKSYVVKQIVNIDQPPGVEHERWGPAQSCSRWFEVLVYETTEPFEVADDLRSQVWQHKHMPLALVGAHATIT